MNLFGYNIQISRPETRETAAVQQRSAAEVGPEAWLRGEDIDTGSRLNNAYEQVVWVYRAINVLAEQVANVPFVFSAGERGRENLITSGPLLDFYARPHPQLNRFQYWELRVIWLMLRGECMRVPIYDEGGPLGDRGVPRLKSVLVLDPARFQHVVEDHRLIGWRYTGFGPQTPLASQVFLPEEVWFEKLPNPFDFWRGFPPLYVADMAARTDYAASQFMRGLIENNADTGVMVRTEKWLSDEQRQQIIGALRDRKRRAGVADRPVLLVGSAEVIKPQLSSADLQFLDNRKFSRAEICAAFGVPEEIVTSTEHAKYDVMAGARLNFIENRVAPLCSRLEAEEEATVRAIDPKANGWFDLDSLPILQEARRSRLAAARTGFEMGVPFNELNRVLDLGFKPLPWGNQGWVTGNLAKVGEGTPESAQKKTGESGREMTTANARAAEGGEWLAKVERWVVAAVKSGKAARLNARMHSKLKRFLFEQRGRVLSACAELQLRGDTGAPAALEERVGRVFNEENEERELQARLGPAAQENGLPVALEIGAGLNRRIREMLAGELKAAGENGESGSQLQARIKAAYNRLALES